VPRVLVGQTGDEVFTRLLAASGELDPVARVELRAPAFSVERELERPFLRASAAIDDGERVVAFCLLWLVADEAHVLDVLTLPWARGRGVGRIVLDAALEDACSGGARVALLEVRRSNHAALALYEGRGFLGYNVRVAYYDDGEDALELVCPLEPGSADGFAPFIPLRR
jgi:ribosomal-protein-alanine N-acetyltransferase